MQSFLANLRLAGGCWVMVFGILLLVAPSGERDVLTTARFWGVIFAGAGLAITLREFAAMLATFLRGKPDDAGSL